jgi:Flp pilus assembly protein TadD
MSVASIMKTTNTAITLVAVDCAYPALAAKALRRSAGLLPVARVLLLTDSKERFDGVEVVNIASIKSRATYSQFMLKALADYIATDYALVVQWDGFVIHDNAFAEEFWNYDYIGAKWPHVKGEFRVGNGGFSLRSQRLLNALRDNAIEFREDENEDETICIRYREYLEAKHGIAFADERVADRFAFDVSRPVGRTLGFHGVFNFWQVLSNDELVYFARTAPELIAKGLGFSALTKNLVDLKRNEVASEFLTRRLASVPHDSAALALRAQLNASLATVSSPQVAQATSAASTAEIKPPASRNDPCPCGSGKRYKECHGRIGAAAAVNPKAPIDVDATVAEAVQLHEHGNVQAAVERYTRALQQAPEQAAALHFMGLAQYQSGQPSAALEAMWRSLELAPNEPEFFSNYSAAAWAAGRYDEGRWAASRAIELQSDHASAYNNLGFNLRAMDAIDASIDAFDQALTIMPQFDYARWNRMFSLLAKGDYTHGFADNELRLQFPQTQPSGKIPANTPLWKGEAAGGKSLLLMCEQGLGDTFMFARFVPMLVARGLKVTFAVQKSQVALMRQSFPEVNVVAVGEHESMSFDYWSPLWSVTSALGITLENLPAPKRFLQTREEDVAKWRERLAEATVFPSPLVGEGLGERETVASSPTPVLLDQPPLPPFGHPPPPGGRGTLRIGLVWQGQFAGQDNQMADRSIPPRLVKRFVEAHPQYTWVSLQHGAAQLAATNLIDWTNDTVEFTQMAALIDALDLVITIDTGAAHLAAALGAETWVMLRHAGDWRYGTEAKNGDQCPWSPTMRLFRQDVARRWEPVFARVSEALETRALQ